MCGPGARNVPAARLPRDQLWPGGAGRTRGPRRVTARSITSRSTALPAATGELGFQRVEGLPPLVSEPVELIEPGCRVGESFGIDPIQARRAHSSHLQQPGLA